MKNILQKKTNKFHFLSHILIISVLFTSLNLFSVIQNGNFLSYASDSDPDNRSYVKNISINKGGQALENGNCEISSDDTLTISYKFIDLYVRTENQNIHSSDSFTFPVPNALTVTSDTSWDVNFSFNNHEYKLGRATYSDANHTITLSLANTEAFSNEAFDAIQSCSLNFNAKLNPDVLGSDSPEQSLTFGFGNVDKFNFTFTDNVITDTAIAKSGQYNTDTNDITWTITVTDGSRVYDNDMRLEDTLSSNQNYITGSFLYDGTTISEGTDASTGLGLNYDDNTKKLTYLYTPASPVVKGTQHTIKYKTCFNEKSYVDNAKDQVVVKMNFTASNNAKLYEQNSIKPLSSDSAEVSTGSSDDVNWLQKSSGETRPQGNDQITTWTVTVDTKGFTFQNLVLTDTVDCTPSNKDITGKSSEFSIVTDSLKVKRASTYDNSISTLYGSSTSATMSFAQGSSTTWSLNLENGANANGIYIITYETKITNYANYLFFNQTPAKNTASLEFDWPDYDGPGVSRHIGVPSVEKDAANIAFNTMLKKTYSSYNPSTHEVTWHIDINSLKQNGMDGIYFKDIINGISSGRKSDDLEQYIPDPSRYQIINLKVNDENADSSMDYLQISCDAYNASNKSQTVSITFNNHSESTPSLLEGNKVSFDLVTTLSDNEADYYENNISKKLENQRRVYNSAQLISGEITLATVNASDTPSITVLEKSSIGYNYDTHHASWSIVVNKDNVPMTNVSVEDKITCGSLDASSVKVDNNAITTDSSNNYYYQYDNSSKLLTIHLKDTGNTLTTNHTITYDTILSSNSQISDGGTVKTLSNYNGTISLSNTATLKKDSSNSTPKATADQDITNDLLKKNVTFATSEPTANYTIYINQPQISWNNQKLITDIMSPGMDLQTPSLQLFTATINTDGSFTQGALVDKSQYSYHSEILTNSNSYNAPAGSTLLTFTLPENTTSAYILKYVAYLNLDEDAVPATFSNQISSEAFSSDDDQTNVTFANSKLKGWGDGIAVTSSKVRLTKKDDENDQAIQGATFEIQYEGQTVATKTTDSSGICTFSNLYPGAVYTLIETEPADGYLIPANNLRSLEFTALEKGNAFYLTKPHEFTNTMNSTTINFGDVALQNTQIMIVDENDNPVTDAAGNELSNTVIDANGKLTLRGLRSGFYRLIMINPPEGYDTSATSFAFSMNHNQILVNGKPVNAEDVKVTEASGDENNGNSGGSTQNPNTDNNSGGHANSSNDNATLSMDGTTITNTLSTIKNTLSPQTGDSTFSIIVTAGIILIISFIIWLILLYKRKSKK